MSQPYQPYLFQLFPSKKALFLASVERTFALIEAAFRGPPPERRRGRARGDGRGLPRAARRRQLLLHQLQAYAASEEHEVREVTRRVGTLWRTVEDLSRASPEPVREWFAMGMLMNVVAALDPGGYDARWATDCLLPELPHTT